ncbi:hypothetical protein BBJ28_00025751 [Nothophytophthora sp. Chile5]|nr:hypothetical protein BBJ28_00025751 [Nothophytophthora sp. Chile5]
MQATLLSALDTPEFTAEDALARLAELGNGDSPQRCWTGLGYPPRQRHGGAATEGRPDAFFASIHLYLHSSGRYFPGTGKSCETSDLVNVALENMGAGADSSSGSQAFRSALENMVLRP